VFLSQRLSQDARVVGTLGQVSTPGKVVPDMTEPSGSESPRGVSRRTVAKAMAWAMPAIAISAAVPAYAASQAILHATGAACKLPGNSGSLYKGYAIGFTATNPLGDALVISIDSVILNGTSLGGTQIVNLIGCTKLGNDQFSVPANTVYPNLVLLTKEAGNSQEGTLAVTYTITGGAGGTVTATATVSAVPPLQSGACTDFTPAEKNCIDQQSRVA
jgi:hypothetical protein